MSYSNRRIPPAPADYDRITWQRILQDIDRRMNHLEEPVEKYTITNAPAESRTLNWSTATQAQINTFLISVILDLVNRGILGGPQSTG